MFGAGTACVVCPIDKMQYLDEVWIMIICPKIAS